MTLKEKFIPSTRKWDEENGWLDDEWDAEECAKIAEEFAVGFAEWFSYLKYNESRYKTNQELLEIYKKEKGL
jgi:hypothetical protein